MNLADVVRLAVLLLGGVVVGSGAVVLQDRARWYKARGMPDGVTAMHLLTAVNALVMFFICATLLARWGQVLSWRVLAAIATFALKAIFFRYLRVLTEQEWWISTGKPAQNQPDSIKGTFNR